MMNRNRDVGSAKKPASDWIARKSRFSGFFADAFVPPDPPLIKPEKVKPEKVTHVVLVPVVDHTAGSVAGSAGAWQDSIVPRSDANRCPSPFPRLRILLRGTRILRLPSVGSVPL